MAVLMAIGLQVEPTVAAADQPAPGFHQQPATPPGQTGGRGPVQGSRNDWWNDPEIKQELRLTEDQSRRIKEIFDKREAEIRPIWDQLNRHADRLDKMTKERVADEAMYAAQVLTVETLYMRVRESRTMMGYRMFRVLQPDQYKKLEEILDRRRSIDRSRGSGPGR
jgi:Spy/CpxP family protein refolding chaperone